MAGVVGFDPAKSGQAPVDFSNNPVPAGVWGDSTIGVGVFGTSGTLPVGTNNIPINMAGVEGHSIKDAGVAGESVSGVGVLGRSSTASGVLGVTFVPSTPGQPPDASGIFGSSVVGGDGVVGFVGDARGVVGNSVRGTGVSGLSGDDDGVSGTSLSRNGVLGVGGVGIDGEIAAGVLGFSSPGFGVQGVSWSKHGVVGNTFGAGDGVYGSAWTDGGVGVEG